MKPVRGPILVLDAASPRVSVAVGTTAADAAVATLELKRSSELLLRAVEEVLGRAGRALGDLAGVAALQGPGSFTGLRIGLATVLGWHQALGLPATAVPTLEVLAATAMDAAGSGSGTRRDVVAAVDALRGDWYLRRFRAGEPPAAAALVAARAIPELAPCRLVGFGVTRLAAEPWWHAPGVELVEPPPLAPAALEIAARGPWEPARLTAPIYFRPPAVTTPRDA